MDVTEYLNRIHYQGSLEPNIETLHQLHYCHLLTVPFENFSIHLNQPINLNLEALYHKIVQQHRGGFCYELNSLFSWLLQQLGFKVTLLSAQVAREEGDFGREFGHLTLRVQDRDFWLADVGFGDSFLYPLKFESSTEQIQNGETYQLINNQNNWIFYHKKEGNYQPKYCFTLTPRNLTDFQTTCEYNQTSPQSIFTQRRICTKPTLEGRVTLSDNRLIITQNGQRQEHIIDTEAEYHKILQDYFGINLDLSFKHQFS
ncbi:arylamine N-acetyltransferase [Limnoraphis robusta Tam1]|uniref:Arylamine N-acetyltransferase n=1 Tax=Limnoraphis robusta CCNP1315 TaxID=3110306 RepID=A0ABU5TY18_9CYAN|nr:arylamine N-acetyltransferase [Limnoraphis robusta]MEA5499158.1 arylamine N-acetyltransferase [Limnoraphis robusta BA-68 BA1]MEA5519849.1 arylamine N-acetyltransferase [Limnoraphis robusta CCNP1315]MEA5537577.1 arylamine N-acetyltransferase [Limnoraphis robusta Tam1]MEA5547884.1 arylamine N-acetyltransferase [Limnoraphis robusta CCNP1324]